MLEKPDLRDQTLIACLQAEYGLLATQIAFLPLGADRSTAAYRLIAKDKTEYFVKLRRGAFDEVSVTLPKYLSGRGISQVIAPLATRTRQLWANLEDFYVVVYPFVEGRDGYGVALSDRHWVELGAALKRIHALDLPPALKAHIPQDTYSPRWRNRVKEVLARIDDRDVGDPIAADLGSYLKAHRAEILELVDCAGRHARTLRARSGTIVLCHSDVHAGNVLIGAGGALYIVDWDAPILALKERDLMYAGGAQGFRGHTPQEEEKLFYQGYGETQIDRIALAYYRYERIVEDIALFCEQVFEGGEGPDREQALVYLKSNFLPGGTIDRAKSTF